MNENKKEIEITREDQSAIKKADNSRPYTDDEINELLKIVEKNNEESPKQKIKRHKTEMNKIETPTDLTKEFNVSSNANFLRKFDVSSNTNFEHRSCSKEEFPYDIALRSQSDMQNALTSTPPTTSTKRVSFNKNEDSPSKIEDSVKIATRLSSRIIDPITPWAAPLEDSRSRREVDRSQSNISTAKIPSDIYYDEDLSLSYRSGKSEKFAKISGYMNEENSIEDENLRVIEKIMTITDNVTLSLNSIKNTQKADKMPLVELLEAQTNIILSGYPLIACKFSYWTSPKFEHEWQDISLEARKLLEFFQCAERHYTFLEIYEFYSKFRIEQLPYLVDSLYFLVNNLFVKKR